MAACSGNLKILCQTILTESGDFYKMKQKKFTTHTAYLPSVFTPYYCHLQLTAYYRFLYLRQLAEVTNEKGEGIGSLLYNR